LLSKLFKSFSKKQNLPLNYFYTTDIHSHLIPDIDDGVKTLEESISIIKNLKELGYQKLITTPHIMSHRFPNTKETILSGLEKVKIELKKQNIDIIIEAAAEYYYDEYFIELIRKKDLLTFGDNHILFELSYTANPFGLEQVVYELLNYGYKPILAHPERYTYYSQSLEKYHNLKDLGLLFQINLNSLNKFYGKNPKIAAEYLVENSLVDFVGSDIHSMRYFDSLNDYIQMGKLEEVFEKNQIKNNFI
jgi:tyrosine-protein phosphatase YwqE